MLGWLERPNSQRVVTARRAPPATDHVHALVGYIAVTWNTRAKATQTQGQLYWLNSSVVTC